MILIGIFALCILLLAYVYVGYPLLVIVLSRVMPLKLSKADVEPFVTILITAYNEEASIRRKIENSLAIEYPSQKLEVIVASDASSDGTDDIAREFADRGVVLHRQEGRMGKTVTQNGAVDRASGEIILFTDATTELGTDVLRKILPAFADRNVGCVSGRLVYVDESGSNVGSGARRYWNYETMLKAAESDVCSLIGASGCLYAVRAEAYRELYAEACSDFIVCTDVYRRGYRTVFEPDAVSYEVTNDRTSDEMNMRVRVIGQTIADLWRNRDMLSPFKSGFFAVELISHKVLRYSVPLILLILFAVTSALAPGSAFFAILTVLQIAFYAAAFLGWVLERSGSKVRLLVIPLYFVLANLASVVAAYRVIRGDSFAAWEPIREQR